MRPLLPVLLPLLLLLTRPFTTAAAIPFPPLKILGKARADRAVGVVNAPLVNKGSQQSYIGGSAVPAGVGDVNFVSTINQLPLYLCRARIGCGE